MIPSFVRAGYTTAKVRTAVSCAMIGLAAGPLPGELCAQVVTPKTLPVLQDGQFDIFPSARAGMAGATIAVDDTLLDPFVNPAKATRVGPARLFVAPFFHSVSGSRGGGRSLPLGGSGSWGAWSVAALFAFQQLDRSAPTFNLSTSDRSSSNEYLSASIARHLSTTNSLGFGVQLASLDAIDGVDLLYAGSDRIKQAGSIADFRLGLSADKPRERHLEAMLIHSRTDMEHDVTFGTWHWDPVLRQSIRDERTDHNKDQTHIWGLHSEYTRPIGSDGWHLGWLGTINRLSHPKIPNYVVQNIPRDPGTTYSANAGLGIARLAGGNSIAADLIYEPMFADTWATAANDTAILGGGTINAGERTVDNSFRFSNVKFRFGVGRDETVRGGRTVIGYQAGIGLYSIKYRLQQSNHVQRTFRTQREDWIEWSPTVGLRLRTGDLDILYNFSLTCGPGSCGASGGNQIIAVPDAFMSAGGIIAAPSSELFMESGSLKIHKLTVSVPIH